MSNIIAIDKQKLINVIIEVIKSLGQRNVTNNTYAIGKLEGIIKAIELISPN